MSEQPLVKVGILSSPTINVDFIKPYTVAGQLVTGKQSLSVTADGLVCWRGKTSDELIFSPTADDCIFEIKDVVIGVNFHWQRKENQRFVGAAKIIVEGGKLTIINVLSVEDYLCSVISSEMSANASLELLKAHAVISRSWLLAQISKKKDLEHSHTAYCTFKETETEIIRWYDREDHVNFDVCADDHCQRYQGVTRQTTEKVADAVAATCGQVLSYDGKLCDARFSKCCGGVLEQFENCWEPKRYNYLLALRDSPKPADFADLRVEANAKEWIETNPDAFCNTDDAEILRQVLNNYDQETNDFYRWAVTYGAAELSELVRERSGIDFGDIVDLVPIERGTSGRIVRLKIVGTKRTMIIGKELEIRRTLSKTHLYSSAFTVEKTEHSFTLRGAGWGHGVGLCQIGAAVMGARGYTYKQILTHYFPNADISKIY